MRWRRNVQIQPFRPPLFTSHSAFHLALGTSNLALHSRLPGLPTAASHLESNGRSREPELVADLVQQEPLVREVKRRRDVREEHEHRRRHAGLRGVKHSHVSAARAGRRCCDVMACTKRFSSGVGTRFRRESATRSIASSSLGARSPLSADTCSRARSPGTSAAAAGPRRTASRNPDRGPSSGPTCSRR